MENLKQIYTRGFCSGRTSETGFGQSLLTQLLRYLLCAPVLSVRCSGQPDWLLGGMSVGVLDVTAIFGMGRIGAGKKES